MSTKRQSQIAKRAAAVRRARLDFTKTYGWPTADVVRAIVEGATNDEIVDTLGFSRGTVAAYRANLTRGAYAPFVVGTPTAGFSGSCNF